MAWVPCLIFCCYVDILGSLSNRISYLGVTTKLLQLDLFSLFSVPIFLFTTRQTSYHGIRQPLNKPTSLDLQACKILGADFI